ncbi:MAG: glutamate racemase [Acidimicrobiia bacterium]|nr:glutamate racemase [Acidimicrobiia bacterium]
MIGVFDSGVGGLSVLREIAHRLPGEAMTYLADQRFAPYGERSLDWVRNRSFEVTDWMLDRGATLIVVACNSASAAALHPLRERHPGVPFVGMEPALKPAASLTNSGVIGVLATTATFQGELFATVLDRHASNVKVVMQPAPGLAAAVEAGRERHPETEALLRSYIEPMLEQGVDTIALGCTHYPFLTPLIQAITGSSVRLIDPAAAVARQVERLLPDSNPGKRVYATTGDAVRFSDSVEHFVGDRARAEAVRISRARS